MGVSADVREFLTLSKGVISEAPPTAFPEDAALECVNFKLNRDGSIQRRAGVDYESGYSLTNVGYNVSDIPNKAVGSYRWDNVGGDSNVSFLAIQVGNTIYFYNATETTVSASAPQSFEITALSGETPISFAAVQGNLVAVHGELTFNSLFTYDTLTSTVNREVFEIAVRDIWGVDSTENGAPIARDYRPTTLDNEHKYNLYNQGYPKEDFYCFVEGSSGDKKKTDVLEYTFGGHAAVGTTGISEFVGLGVYPSNSDTFSFSVLSSTSEGPIDVDGFNPRKLDSAALGNTPSTKGHFIINPFGRSVSRRQASQITFANGDVDSGGPTSVVASGERLFFSNLVRYRNSQETTAPRMTNTILFSRVIRNKNDYGVCYQEADPTSVEDNQLLADDGGTISIAEVGNIHKLEAVGNNVIVLADNGVWEIRGGESGFRATDFYVRKVSNVGAAGKSAILNVEGTVFYWSYSGIYVITADQVSGNSVAQSLTESSIQTKFKEIPNLGIANASGFFDSQSREVKWAYNDSEVYSEETGVYVYNKELVYNTSLGSFTFNHFGSITDGPYIAGYAESKPFTVSTQETYVYAGSGGVQDSSSNDVVVTSNFKRSSAATTKYITLVPGDTYSLTLSQFGDTNYKDWALFDGTGVDAAAHAEFGYLTFGDSSRVKQGKYATMHFKRTETGYETNGGVLEFVNPSACQARIIWGYANSSTYAKYGTAFEAYRLGRNYIPSGAADSFDYGESIISTKTRLRGSGLAMRLRIDTSEGKDLHMYGWSLNLIGMSNV